MPPTGVARCWPSTRCGVTGLERRRSEVRVDAAGERPGFGWLDLAWPTHALCGYERALFREGIGRLQVRRASRFFAGPFLPFLRGCSMIASGPGNTRLV